jgi:hypothetical protein
VNIDGSASLTDEELSELQRTEHEQEADTLAFVAVFATPQGRRVLDVLNAHTYAQPEPGSHGADHAWWYLGQMSLLKTIFNRIEEGRALATRRAIP